MDKKGFNLLRPQLVPQGSWDSVYNWVNGTARIIVIAVELVVIVCFVLRVIVDRQARDLEETLTINQNELNSLAEEEKEIRDLQTNLANYANLWQGSSEFAPYVKEIYNYNPTIYNDISILIEEKGRIRITGVGNEERTGEIEKMMKNSDSYSLVQLTSFIPGGDTGDEPGEFQITAQSGRYTREAIGGTDTVSSTGI